MIGGPPISSQPIYPSYPANVYPGPQWVEQPPAPWPSAPPPMAPPPPRQTAPVLARQSVTPRPTFRGQMPEEPTMPVPPAPSPAAFLKMPPPDQLGVAASAITSTGGADWGAAHRRLDRLGANFHLEKLAEGGCRFSCWVPSGQADRPHRVEAQAATEADAVNLALDEAERYAASK